MENIQELFKYTLKLLEQMSIRHEYRSFPSGAIMLDVWHNDRFYVFQFEDYIGFSEIDSENIGFDTNPDEKFHNANDYKEKLNSILNSKRC